MSRAIEIGFCNKENNVYILLTWVDGHSLNNVLGELAEHEQYKIGLQAGKY